MHIEKCRSGERCLQVTDGVRCNAVLHYEIESGYIKRWVCLECKAKHPEPTVKTKRNVEPFNKIPHRMNSFARHYEYREDRRITIEAVNCEICG